MKCLILDDDPTGTQSASDALVLLRWDAATLTDALRARDAVYLLTNTRAVDEPAAVALLESIKRDRDAASIALGEPVHVVLRGDSTLRGHVFAETEVFAGADDIVLFVPAFPQGGRTTRDGMHYVRLDGADIPAHESEYAADPVFAFDTGYLPDYVRQRSRRPPAAVPLDVVRAGALPEALAAAQPGTVVLPDAVTDDDIRRIAHAVQDAWARGRRLVVRSASPLAAAIAKVESAGLLPVPLLDAPIPTLLVCGSHTDGATRQLAPVTQRWGAIETIGTDAAFADPDAEAARIVAAVQARLEHGFAAFASERVRRPEHNTLAHGERVMAVLTDAVAALRDQVGVVVSKGGITSADVARVGLGAERALVRGQVLPGVSVWDVVTPEGQPVLYVVVPGNVGDPGTLVELLEAVRAGE
ncbi:four-carbon acid sugar kinase family protein [Microbacterium terrisoli]|uniref:four-carbon acid sugar kinase family protein n=1 Tax=Microbacterium terrisoli TaxID=3242192 RepID=UPI00280551A0|nr:four-carbon acid sugar kinase family protein [Microbacterium protaetiae]